MSQTQLVRVCCFRAMLINVQSTQSTVESNHLVEDVMYFRSSSIFIAIRICCAKLVVTIQFSMTKAGFNEGMKGSVERGSK